MYQAKLEEDNFEVTMRCFQIPKPDQKERLLGEVVTLQTNLVAFNTVHTETMAPFFMGGRLRAAGCTIFPYTYLANYDAGQMGDQPLSEVKGRLTSMCRTSGAAASYMR
jgi:hypothetical protein